MASKSNGVKRTFLSYYAQCRPSRSSLASFSSSIERAKARKAAAESTGDTSLGTAGGTYNYTGAPDPTRQSPMNKQHKKHDDGDDNESGLTGYAAGMVKDVTDKVGETVKRTVDGGVKAMEQMKEATGGGQEEKRGPNYRMDVRDDREKTIDDLRRRAGGYDTTK